MSKKEQLRKYMESYGEIDFLKDISSILDSLGKDWKDYGDKYLYHVFADSANLIRIASSNLEQADTKYNQTNEPGKADFHKEFAELSDYFSKLSMTDLSAIFTHNKEDFIKKLKRFDFLKNKINEKDKKD